MSTLQLHQATPQSRGGDGHGKAGGACSAIAGRLAAICDRHGIGDVAARLREAEECVSKDMAAFVAGLALPRTVPSVLHGAAAHLLRSRGKHLRPMCVALASEVGAGFGPEARELAVAVELIHNATLLHDDVIDMADHRRDSRTARIVYGNTASILSGDWLLIQALSRIRRASGPCVLDRALSTIEAMITAEALQLAQRGRIETDLDRYFSIIRGKTASLFRLAMFAGAKAGGSPEDQCHALEEYGGHLGEAFQLVDDLLDFVGDERRLGKALFTDLREGKMTYPLLLALRRDPELAEPVESLLTGEHDQEAWHILAARVLDALHSSGSVQACRALARQRAAAAIGSLDGLDGRPARAALVAVAEEVVSRDA